MEDIIEEFKNSLLDIPYAHYSNDKRNIVFRCPFCGDSQKNHDSTHFSVKVDELGEAGGLPIFHCFRCEVGGVFTSDVFRQLDIHNSALITSITRYNKKAMRNSKYSRYQTDKKRTIILPRVNDFNELDRLSQLKIKYIEKRLGIQLEPEDIEKYKIVLNLKETLTYNNISKFTYKDYMIDTLDKYFVGFLSANNEYINLRNVFPKQHKLNGRYFNYNIFDSFDNTKKFFIIPNKIDMLSQDIEIILTEGYYDILGVYNHIMNKNDENKIYCAVCGSGFYSVIKYFLKRGILNFKISIYSDNEKNRGKRFYEKLKREISYFHNGNIFVYYNQLSKDFGVPAEEIETTRMII